MIRFADRLCRTLLATGSLVFAAWAADPPVRPPTPSLPPFPPGLTPQSAPGTPVVRTNLPNVVVRPKPVYRTNIATVSVPGPAPRVGAVAMPFSDPTYIPGLVPLQVAGPPVPLAPTQPTRTYRTAAPPPTQETVFAYDALVKEATLKPGETSAIFSFSLTNTSASEVTIHAVRTSCGCTVAKLPAAPWKIPAHGSGSFDVVLDARGKSGVLTKTVTIDSTAGYRYLSVRASIPAGTSPMASADRARNLQLALADRQAVFKGDCAACHLQPAIGQHGMALYQNACGVCHEAEHRASMVPNLRALNKPTDREYWRNWVSHGKTGTLMPAWSVGEGGPLNDAQIKSLVDYLTGPFKSETAPPHPPPTAASQPQRPNATLQPVP